MDSEVSQSSHTLDDSQQAIQHSINITESLLDKEREAAQQDRFGRRASEMPKELRQLYQTGQWRSGNVYIWPSVLQLSKTGHEHAAQAEAALNFPSYKPKTTPDGQVIANSAIADAFAVCSRIGDRLSKVVAAQKAARFNRLKELSKVYMRKRTLWISKLDALSEQRSDEATEKAKQFDRDLLAATKSSKSFPTVLSNREIDLIFLEYESAGGTAGGLERWGRSITGIPNQNPHSLPPPQNGGGVLVQNPLAEHYAARSINPWTATERLLFLEKFVVHGKNFRKIATFFEHKAVDDCIRFYYDNKMRLNLKQLAKDSHMRKRGNRKAALHDLSRMPEESRSIKDNFLYQTGFLAPENQQEPGKDPETPQKHSTATLGKGWTPTDRQALIFALCRHDVTADEEEKPISTVWASIAAYIGSKTPRQCRHFYFQYKTILGLDSYFPPKQMKRPLKRPTPSGPSGTPTEDPTPRKLLRRSNSVLRNTTASVGASMEEYYVSSGATAGRIA